MSVFSGKCLCGNVTYKCHAKPTVIFNCYCENCRRAKGRYPRRTAYDPGSWV